MDTITTIATNWIITIATLTIAYYLLTSAMGTINWFVNRVSNTYRAYPTQTTIGAVLVIFTAALGLPVYLLLMVVFGGSNE